MNPSTFPYHQLLDQITTTYQQGRSRANVAVNQHLLETYWQIGKYIVEFEQKGAERAEYGSNLIKKLSQDLKLQHAKGFSMSNLSRMRQFYQEFPILATLSQELSWSHYVELLKIEDSLERDFYLNQAVQENWSIRELKRQKHTNLFLRLAVSKDKEHILKLAKEGQRIQRPDDLIREPYILAFLHIPEPYHLSEAELERRIIDHLQDFLLELGKGFAFISRQYRITLGNRHHYVDLVFYHRILKCFVLIDLKVKEAGYEDVGQMNMYLGYFESEENVGDDNPPIGIILSREKDELLIKYAMHNVTSQLFVSKYQFYLPDRDELKRLIEKQLEDSAPDENTAS